MMCYQDLRNRVGLQAVKYLIVVGDDTVSDESDSSEDEAPGFWGDRTRRLREFLGASGI